jgi:hypothetical protein
VGWLLLLDDMSGGERERKNASASAIRRESEKKNGEE